MRLSALLVLACSLSAALATTCSDQSFSCSRCVKSDCVYAYVTMDGGPDSQFPPRWLPHGCVKKVMNDMQLDKLRRSPARELTRSGIILQGLLQVAKLHDSQIAFIGEDQAEMCTAVVDGHTERLPGKTSQERITRVVKTAMQRQKQMLAHLTPIQKSRDTSTWFKHLFDDEIDAACDEFLRMDTSEREKMGMSPSVSPALDLLPIASNLGAYMLARQVRRSMGYVGAHAIGVNPDEDTEFQDILSHTRLAMEVSCRYLTCLVDFGSAVVYDDLIGSDGEQLGNGLGLPCRYCRRLGTSFSNPRPSVVRQASILVNGVCKSMREYSNVGNHHRAAMCAVTAGQAFVQTLQALQRAMDDPTGDSDSTVETAVTALTMQIATSDVCQSKSNSAGHWASRVPSSYEQNVQAAADTATEMEDNMKTSLELQEWRSSGVAQRVVPELYPKVDLS